MQSKEETVKNLINCGTCGYPLTPEERTTLVEKDGVMVKPAPVQEPVNLHQVLTDPENQPNQFGVKFGMHGEKMMFKVGWQQFALDYEPETQDEFDFMRDMLVHAFSTFTHGVKTTPPAAPVQEPEKLECMNCAAFGECNPNNDAGRCGYEPPAAQRQWVGLTVAEMEELTLLVGRMDYTRMLQLAEAKLKEKNT
jgi:hypothetical protein